jgi:hypothetical protein
VISSSQRQLPIQHTTNTGTNIHALNWIRTSIQGPSELRLRPHGHRRRPPSATNSHMLTARCPLPDHTKFDPRYNTNNGDCSGHVVWHRLVYSTALK